MQKFILWLVLSSQDPQKTSLMVRGGLVVFFSWLSVVAGFANITLPGEEVTALVNHVTLLAQAFFLFVGLVVTVFGAARKLWRTAFGTNEVIKAMAE